MLIAIYLAAIVAANLAVAHFGPSSTTIVAFLLIGLDITTRDVIHEKWRGKHLWLKMMALIATGGLISWLLNRGAGSVAVASLVSFVLSGAIGALAYQVLRRRGRGTAINGSNAAAAVIDSMLFPTIAFNALMPGVVLGQFVAKVVGGYLWSLVMVRQEMRRVGSDRKA